jgi:hypothetical protein
MVPFASKIEASREWLGFCSHFWGCFSTPLMHVYENINYSGNVEALQEPIYAKKQILKKSQMVPFARNALN